MRCPFCNNEVPDGSAFCTYCGKQLKQTVTYSQNTYSPYSQKTVSDDAGCFAILISLFMPAAGFALYLVWRDYRPNSAKTCLIPAIIGFIIQIISNIIAVFTQLNGFWDFFNIILSQHILRFLLL
ncbi:MAG TPA: zinc ribbon domain-containing protein [Clostridia bacterium]